MKKQFNHIQAHLLAVKHYNKYLKKQIKDIFYNIKIACLEGKTEYVTLEKLTKETIKILETQGYLVTDLGEFHSCYKIQW